MRTLSAFLLSASLSAFTCAAHANILINVDKSTQRMTVSEDGRVLYNWPVSTGKPGHATPSGSYQTFRMEPDHYSKEWDDAPMPYSIFFTKVGHAIHGTYSKNIGIPVSHGCVRLSVDHAAKLYAMVQKEGVLKTKVVLTGSEQIALKRNHRVMTAARESNPATQKPQPQPQPQPQYRQAAPVAPSPYGEPQYSEQQSSGERYYDPRYGDQRSPEPQYVDRSYEDRSYVSPNYSYGAREYRPQPQYMQPSPSRNAYDNRYGIY